MVIWQTSSPPRMQSVRPIAHHTSNHSPQWQKAESSQGTMNDFMLFVFTVHDYEWILFAYPFSEGYMHLLMRLLFRLANKKRFCFSHFWQKEMACAAVIIVCIVISSVTSDTMKIHTLLAIVLWLRCYCIYIWICSQTSKIIRFWRYIVASTPTNGFIYIKHVHVVCTLLQLVYLWHAHLSFCTCSRYTRYITSEHNVCSDFYKSIGEDEKILLSKKNKTHVWLMVVNASSAPHHRIGTHVRSLVGHVPGKVKTCNFPEITQTDAHG